MREHLAPQPVARVACVVVALVVYPLEAVGGGITLDVRTRHCDQWPQQRSPGAAMIRRQAVRSKHERHPGEASHARASEELQQHGFGLIVEIVCEHDVIGPRTA